MLDTPALAAAAAGVAFLVASHAPEMLGQHSAEARIAAHPSGKGDRLPAAKTSSVRKPVTVVEIVGAQSPTVVLRARDGSILYRSDSPTATTLVAKDADLPIVTLRESAEAPSSPRAPKAEEPIVREEHRERPPEDRARGRTVGCESAVSPLVRGTAAPALSRCLADAEVARQRPS